MNTIYIISGCAFIVCFWITWKTYPKKKNKFVLLAFNCLVLMTIAVIPVLSEITVHISHDAILLIKEGIVNWRNILLPVHIVLAIPCTLLGPFLLYEPFRNKFLKIHRQLGKIYVVCTLSSAILVFPLSLTNGGGLVGKTGFTTMAILWFFFTLKAYTAIIDKRVIEHKHWMMRSYAMTFAFVHVNVTYNLIGVYEVINYNPISIKILQSYASWLFNLIVVEIYINRKEILKQILNIEDSEQPKDNSLKSMN